MEQENAPLRLSLLLAELPPDEVLETLYTNGNRPSCRRHLTRKDLLILRLRAEGRTYAEIGVLFGITGRAIRAKLLPIKLRLTRDLDVVLDVPGIFP